MTILQEEIGMGRTLLWDGHRYFGRPVCAGGADSVMLWGKSWMGCWNLSME